MRENKFRGNIRDSLNPIYNKGKRTETTKRFFIHCKIFAHEKQAFLQNIGEIDSNSFHWNLLIEDTLTHIPLHGDTKFADILNIWFFNFFKTFLDFLKIFYIFDFLVL